MLLRIRTIARVVWLDTLRRKDLYVMLILLGALLLSLTSLNLFGLGGAVGYVKDVGLMVAWLFGLVLAITVSSRELPREESRATIFPLLAKPVTRWEVILGKWLGSWTVVAAALFFFYALVVIVVTAKGGAFLPAALAQGILLHALAMAIMTAATLLFSARLNQDAAASLAYVFSAAAFLVLPRAPEFLVREKGLSGNVLLLLYHVLPRVELFDLRQRLVHGYGAVSWPVFAVVLLYGLLYVALFLALAWFAYRSKRFSRENVG